jgi:SIR2-like domain
MTCTLLTGAGFTKTFGGYLATEMWAAIFNQQEVQKSETLLKGMRQELNYEKFYDHIQSHGEDHEKKALSSAVRNAFEEMEDILNALQRVPRERSRAVACCTSFITRLAPAPGPNFVFTLNQDMYFERFHSNEIITEIPGVEQDSRWFRSGMVQLERNSVRLPTIEELERRKDQFKRNRPQLAYIKLHGSHRWTSHDGSDVMVIGTDKESMIGKEPLLQWYYSLFNDVLNRPGARLLTIGYGFGDRHVNECIKKAIDHGLKLYVISPQLPEDFKERLIPLSTPKYKPVYHGTAIWNAVVQYWPAKVTDFYPQDINSSVGLTPQGLALFRSLGLS